MSLFEDSRYIYRDTLFVFFQQMNRPKLLDLVGTLETLDDKFRLDNIKTVDIDGQMFVESATLFSPQDYSAMDIVYVQGTEVREQVSEIFQEFRTVTLTGDDRKHLDALSECDARFDVFHFGEVVQGSEEDEILDPGGLLLVLQSIARLTQGVSFDPQSQDLN